MKTIKHLHGFSLVELLVAMVVGLIIISGAFSLHSTTRATQAVNEAQMDMVADARFAIDLITYDLRHAGMWGGNNLSSTIMCISSDPQCVPTAAGDTPPVPETGDCAIGWYYDLHRQVFAIDGSTGNPYSGSCIPLSEGYQSKPDALTDILVIRYADSNYLDTLNGGERALTKGQVYVRSNFIDGRIFVGTTPPELRRFEDSDNTHNYLLHAFAYYISDHTDSSGDGIPSLRRVTLVNGPAMENQTLVSGVYDLQVQFGEDVTGDGAVNRYVNPDQVVDWLSVNSAKVWLVMRSEKRQYGVDTAKTFSIAGRNVSYGGQDDYRYFLATSVVDLRNIK